MNRHCFNVAERGPPYPILVRYPGSGAAASSLAYIVCLNGCVPDKYELWSLNAQGVRLFNNFTEDTLRTTFYNSRRCCIPFIGQRFLNGSVQFIRFADVTSDSTSKNNIYSKYLRSSLGQLSYFNRAYLLQLYLPSVRSHHLPERVHPKMQPRASPP